MQGMSETDPQTSQGFSRHILVLPCHPVGELIEPLYSSSSLCISSHSLKDRHTIFKNYRMKTYTSKSAKQDQDNTSVYEAFVEYLNSVYFEGAAETLDKELINFEYAAYISCYGN